MWCVGKTIFFSFATGDPRYPDPNASRGDIMAATAPIVADFAANYNRQQDVRTHIATDNKIAGTGLGLIAALTIGLASIFGKKRDASTLFIPGDMAVSCGCLTCKYSAGDNLVMCMQLSRAHRSV